MATLRSEDLDQVRTELQKCGTSAVLDLEEVNLADVEGVCFLNACEANGISVVHCSPYIREWMSLERGERKYTLKHSKDGSFGRSVRGSTANPSRRSAHNC